MKLNILERLMGLSVLIEYKEGNFITFKTIAGLKLKLTVNEQEVKDFNIRIENEKYVWNSKGNEYIEFDITDGEKNLIKDLLVKMDENNKLTENHYSIYEKFVLE